MWTIWVCPDCGCTNMHAETCGAFPGEPVWHGNRVHVVDPAEIVAWLRGRTGAHGGGFSSADDVADAIEREFGGEEAEL